MNDVGSEMSGVSCVVRCDVRCEPCVMGNAVRDVVRCDVRCET